MEAAENVLRIIQHRDELDPLRVLGVKCTSRFPLWIVSSMCIISFVLLQYLFFGQIYVG
jgi:hypothetical protein